MNDQELLAKIMAAAETAEGAHLYGEDEPADKNTLVVALVWNGRDCDGVQYSGQVQLVRASLSHVKQRVDEEIKWADGPCYCEIAKFSEVWDIGYEEVDLTSMAHENGHPYSLNEV
jgi:hypothetical protein